MKVRKGQCYCDENTRLQRWIEQKTGGRVHGLKVDCGDDAVVIYGNAGSYAVRQEVLVAALEALRGKSDKSVCMEVAVSDH